jgi:N-acetylmuramoyl-L-alanine amidase
LSDEAKQSAPFDPPRAQSTVRTSSQEDDRSALHSFLCSRTSIPTDSLIVLFRLSLFIVLLAGIATASLASGMAPRSVLDELLQGPSPAQWNALSAYDGTLTRKDFVERLDRVFDPAHGIQRYLRLSSEAVVVYPTPAQNGEPLAVVRFAATTSIKRPLPVRFRSPRQFRDQPAAPGVLLLSGLRIAIDPADIGGRWAALEDRSVEFRGYGRINEGDMNLLVGRRLREELERLGASVFLVRDKAEPVLPVSSVELLGSVETLLKERPELAPERFRRWQSGKASADRTALRVAANFFITKTLETRARVALVQRSFQPDITIVLQHNATPESTDGLLTKINRNIFFVDGACLPEEMQDAEQRYRVLLKLLENVTPIETEVGDRIARRFEAVTGFPPVLYGNSANTVTVAPQNPYVVARNLALNRDHDGPVVVTEPYFMNQPETLLRLLAGDYSGERIVAGKPRISIFCEYARCVAEGLVATYGRSTGSNSRAARP